MVSPKCVHTEATLNRLSRFHMCLCLTVIIIEEITNLEGKDTEEVGGGEGGHFVNKVLVYEILKNYKFTF